MNKFSLNDVSVLQVLEEMQARYRSARSVMVLFDKLQINHGISQQEALNSLQYLEKINYVAVNGRGSHISLTEYLDSLLSQGREKILNNFYSLEEKKAARFKMLEKLYMESGSSENIIFNIHDIGKDLKFTPDLNKITYQYLVGENLIKFRALGGFASITHYGVIEYENAISSPEKESRYFPPANIVNNILHIESISSSQVQVGSNGSTQIMNDNAEFSDLKKWIVELEKTLIEDASELPQTQSIKEELESIKALLSAKEPNKKYIRMALNTIKDIIIGITANAIFQKFISQIPALLPH